MREKSPRYRSVGWTQIASTMNAPKHHNTMSSTEHGWISVLMVRHRMQRSASTRERKNVPLPGSPFSDHASLRKQFSSHARLMSDCRIRTPESSPRQSSKKKLPRATLQRRLTSSTCDSHASPNSDIPFEISIRIADDQREEMDDVSELSVEDDDFSFAGESFNDRERELDGVLGSLSGHPCPTNPMLGVEPTSWGIATLCLDDHDAWPSDEGSPKKKREWRTLGGVPIQISSLDDERQDCVGTPILKQFSQEEAKSTDEDRHEKPVVV